MWLQEAGEMFPGGCCSLLPASEREQIHQSEPRTDAGSGKRR